MGNPDRIEAIDALRGLAALAVVLFHYVAFIPLMGISVGPIGSVVVALTRYGYLGVPIFFVLSGYVIAMTASRYTFTPSTGARFILRRLVRIAPPYWVMVLLTAATLIAGRTAGYFKNTPVTSGQVVAHLAYAQNVLGFRALDVAYWTLCLEVQFYLVFALSAVALHRSSPRLHLVWFAALSIGSFLINWFDLVPQAWFPHLWYQFGVGVLVYDVGRVRSARPALFLLLAILVGLGISRSQPADLVVVFVAGLLLSRNRPSGSASASSKVLLGLGQISYSLYLVHGFVGMGLHIVFRSSAISSGPAAWIAVAVGIAGSLAFATAFHYLCERPVVGWSRLVRAGPARVSASGPAGPGERT